MTETCITLPPPNPSKPHLVDLKLQEWLVGQGLRGWSGGCRGMVVAFEGATDLQI